MDTREIVHIDQARLTSDGAGVKLKRVFGGQNFERYDPFLLMDDFGSETAALEGALALIFLHKFSKSNDPVSIHNIFVGRIESILMLDDESQSVEALLTENAVRQEKLKLIESNQSLDSQLLKACLQLNRKES